jgi:hypothetical protein
MVELILDIKMTKLMGGEIAPLLVLAEDGIDQQPNEKKQVN